MKIDQAQTKELAREFLAANFPRYIDRFDSLWKRVSRIVASPEELKKFKEAAASAPTLAAHDRFSNPDLIRACQGLMVFRHVCNALIHREEDRLEDAIRSACEAAPVDPSLYKKILDIFPSVRNTPKLSQRKTTPIASRQYSHRKQKGDSFVKKMEIFGLRHEISIYGRGKLLLEFHESLNDLFCLLVLKARTDRFQKNAGQPGIVNKALLAGTLNIGEGALRNRFYKLRSGLQNEGLGCLFLEGGYKGDAIEFYISGNRIHFANSFVDEKFRLLDSFLYYFHPAPCPPEIYRRFKAVERHFE